MSSTFRDMAEAVLRDREAMGEQYRPGVVDAAVDACCEAENVFGVVNAIQRVFRAYEMQQ